MKNSADTLQAIWENRPLQVAEGIRQAHFETSHIQYNDENALSYTVSLALYAARNFYTFHRELSGGKGFADLVFIPRKKFSEKPALVVELKWDKTARGAITQIKEKSIAAVWKNIMENFCWLELIMTVKKERTYMLHRRNGAIEIATFDFVFSML